MATQPDIGSLRELLKQNQEFFHIQSQRLAEIQQSDPDSLSDADKNSISSWDKSVVKDCNRQLMMLEEIAAPTIEEREIMQELNKLITLGDHIMEKRNLVHAELNDRVNAMKKSNAAKAKPSGKDNAQKKPESTPTSSAEKNIALVNDQALDATHEDPSGTAVPPTTAPVTAQSSTMAENQVQEANGCPETLADDVTAAFDPKELYAIMKIDPGTPLDGVKKAAKRATLILHPDRNPDDPNAASRFADFQAVCQVFASEEARQEFDETGNVEEIEDLQQRLLGLISDK